MTEKKNKPVDITKFTKKDFEGSAPYDFLYSLRGNGFTHAQVREKLAAHAKSVGYTAFKTTYAQYQKQMQQSNDLEIVENNIEGFDELSEAIKDEYISGVWQIEPTTGAIFKQTEKGSIIACSHPICPISVLIDVETGKEKVELMWKRGNKITRQTFERAELANASKVVNLAAYGVSVTSETARALVSWLNDALDLNINRLKMTKSVSRLGYIGSFGFSPYAEGLTYDGGIEYEDIFKAVKPSGNYDKWIEKIREIRADSRLAPRVMLAASFASVLVEPLHAMPFFVHLYGGSGNGKTVALQMCSSVWGNPQSYIKTFNATKVGMETLAGFLHNLPLCLDELQIQRTQGADFEAVIYDLSEGTGRTRGNRGGGLRNTATWRNTILTTGETPMVTAASAGGVANRVIELDTTDLEHIFDDASKLSRFFTKNHGYAGKEFVRVLTEKMQDSELVDAWLELKDYYQAALMKRDITDKQATIGALILVADNLINDFIFHDKQTIDLDEFAKYLKTNAQASENRRAHEWILEWLAQNRAKFNEWDSGDTYRPELYGTFARDGKSVRVLKNVFYDACDKAGYDPSNVLKYLKKNKLTICDEGRTTRKTRVNGISHTVHVVELKLLDDDEPKGFTEMDEPESAIDCLF